MQLMMDQLVWRKSSRSGNGGACVELACASGQRLVRDSKKPDGPQLAFSTEAVNRLLRGVRG
jgi:hypothetical protein